MDMHYWNTAQGDSSCPIKHLLLGEMSNPWYKHALILSQLFGIEQPSRWWPVGTGMDGDVIQLENSESFKEWEVVLKPSAGGFKRGVI